MLRLLWPNVQEQSSPASRYAVMDEPVGRASKQRAASGLRLLCLWTGMEVMIPLTAQGTGAKLGKEGGPLQSTPGAATGKNVGRAAPSPAWATDGGAAEPSGGW